MSALPGLYPAPWSWDGEFPIEILDAEGHYVVSSGGMFPSGEANARLIAAAPDLLAAAKAALAEAESWIHDQLDGTGMVDEALSALEPIRVAIAKAEGR